MDKLRIKVLTKAQNSATHRDFEYLNIYNTSCRLTGWISHPEGSASLCKYYPCRSRLEKPIKEISCTSVNFMANKHLFAKKSENNPDSWVEERFIFFIAVSNFFLNLMQISVQASVTNNRFPMITMAFFKNLRKKYFTTSNNCTCLKKLTKGSNHWIKIWIN